MINAVIESFSTSGSKTITVKPAVVSWDDSTAVFPNVNIREYALNISPQSTFNLSNLATTVTNYQGVVTITTDYRYGWDADVISGPCGLYNSAGIIVTSLTQQPSGQLKFNYTGGTGTNATIRIRAGETGNRVEKLIFISR
jgi:hypothetical protein